MAYPNDLSGQAVSTDMVGLQSPYSSSLYDAYMRSPLSQAVVPEVQSAYSRNPVPPFARSSDPYVLDTDPFGTKTERWGERTGQGYRYDTALSANVFGKAFSREQLMQYDAGRKLLDIEEKNRRGVRRGFVEAITDFQWSDLPFVSLFASVGKSVSDAVVVSRTFEKMQKGEAVSDEDLIKTRLYMAEQERNSNGTWGATVGDIMRAAPGFMAEFALSGGLYSAARTGVAKLGERGIHLGLTRATKVLAREATEESAKRVMAKAFAETADDVAGNVVKMSADKALKGQVVRDVRKQVFSMIWDSAAGKAANPLYEGLSYRQAAKLAQNRAEYEFEKMVARSGSTSALRNGYNGFKQWLGNNMSRGIMDFGAWGTEETTAMFRKSSSAGKALADAIGALVVEAPVKGTAMALPNMLVAKPALSSAFGGGVSQAELSLKESAYLQDNPELMSNAESIAMGINLLEYVSENAGHGFKHLGRAVGIRMEKAGAKGAAKAAVESLRGSPLVKEPLKFGSSIRKWVDDVFGTRQQYVARMSKEKTRLVSEALAKSGVSVDGQVLETAVRSGNSSVLPQAVREAIGNDIAGFAEKTVDAAYRSGRRDLEYKSFARYMVADFMTKHNIGPQSVMNLYEKMGYDGVLGEMMEERYSDVVKGMLGLDDRATHDFMSNLKEAVKGIYPGFDQLTAEAVGFSVPMVTRAGAMKLMSSIGGEGKYARLRERLEAVDDLVRHPVTTVLELGQYRKLHENTMEEIGKRIDSLKQERESEAAIGNQERVRAIDAQIEQDETERTNRQKTFDASIKSVEDAAKDNAGQMVAFEPMTREEATGPLYNLRPNNSPQDAASAITGRDSLVAFAPELSQMLASAKMAQENEDRSVFRSIARKTVGMAGALVTGDFSLMASNPAQWNSRDMGLSRELCDSLADGYVAEWKRNQAALEARLRETASEPGSTLSATRSEVDAMTLESFSSKAKHLMSAYLTAHQMRAFSGSQMLEQAVDVVSRSYGFDGIGADGNLIRFDKEKDDIGGFDDAAPSADRFYSDHKEEVDAVRDRIAYATADILQNRTTGFASVGTAVMPAIRLPNFDKDVQTDAITDNVVYDAAMKMVGESYSAYELDEDTPVDVAMRSHSVLNANMDVLNYVADASRRNSFDKPDANLVDRRAMESLANAFRFRFDGTDESLRKRDEAVLKVALQAAELSDPDSMWFQAPASDRVDQRLSRNGNVVARAVRQADGRYRIASDFAQDGSKLPSEPASAEEIAESMRKLGYSPVSSGVSVTQVRTLVSEDPIAFLKDFGWLKSARDAMVYGSEADESYAHPYLRKDENGKWKFDVDTDEGRAEYRKVLSEELSTASLWDPRIGEARSVPRGKTQKDVEDAYARVYGPDGYMTVVETVLRSHNVDVSDAAALRTGRADAYSRKQYSFTVQTGMMPGSVDTFVPVDFGKAEDYTDAFLSAKLMQAYSKHPGVLRQALGNSVSDYLGELDALVTLRIGEAAKNGDRELVEQLRDFRLTCTSAVDRIGDDGKVRKGAGVSPLSFVTVASAFPLYQIERRAKAGTGVAGLSRALADLAPYARKLPSYFGFAQTVDLMLGGNGFVRQGLSEEDLALSEQRGLQRAMSVFSGDEGALRKAVSESGPGGMSFERFADNCSRFLQQQAKVQVPQEKMDEIRGKAASLDSGNFSDLSSFLSGVADAAGVKPEEVSKFFSNVVAFAKEHGEDLTGGDPSGIVARAVEGAKTFAADSARISELSTEAAGQRKTDEELTASIREKDAEIGRIMSAPESTEADVEAKKAALVAARDVVEAERDKLREQAARTSESLAGAVDKARADRAAFAPLAVDGVGLEPVSFGAKAQAENGHVQDASLSTGAFGQLPEKFGSETAAAVLSGIRSSAQASFNGLTAKQASRVVDTVANVIASTGEPMDADTVGLVADRLFAGSLKSPDKAFIMDQFSRRNDALSKAGKTWDDELARISGNANVGVSEPSDVKEDDDSANDSRKFNIKSVDVYNDPELGTFLTLAQLTSPETGRNFQAFAVNLRDTNRKFIEQLDAEAASYEAKGVPVDQRRDRTAVREATGFMYRLLNPRASTVGKSFNERQALHVADLAFMDTPGGMAKVRGYVKTLLREPTTGKTVSRKSAMFLSYLMSMPISARKRFTQLVANSAVCTPVSTWMSPEGAFAPMSDASRSRFDLSEETLASSFAWCVGKSSAELSKMKEELVRRAGEVKGVTEADLRTGGQNLYVKLNAIADHVVAPVFGTESPLYSALTSPALARRLPSLVARGEGGSGTVGKQLSEMLSDVGGQYGFARYLTSVLDALSTRKGSVTSDDVASAAVGVASSGFSDQAGLHMGPNAASIGTPFKLLLSMYEDSLPETVMGARIDESRGGDSSKIAIASRGVVPMVSRWLDNDENGFLSVAARFFPKTDDVVLARCRQDMTWPDGTPILAKNIAKSYNVQETLRACAVGYEDAKQPYFYVPVYSGDHSSSVMIQVPKAIDVRSEFKGDASGKGAGSDALEKWWAQHTDYLKAAGAISDSLGLALLGNDTKRSAVTSLESPGMGMYGVEVDEHGNVTKRGSCRTAIVYNFRDGETGASNEEMLGTTILRGYGAEQVRACAQDPESQILKIHGITTGGRNLEFRKSLAVSTTDKNGRPLAGSYQRVYEDFADKYVGKDGLSTLFLTDLDSYKIGPAKSAGIGLVDADGNRVMTEDGKDPETILGYLVRRVKAVFNNGESLPDSMKLEDVAAQLFEPGIRLRDVVRGETFDVLPKESAEGQKPQLSMEDVLKGLEIRRIDGLNGPVMALVYDQSDMTAYTVANVSHKSSFSVGEVGRTPANHVTDMLTMGVAQLRALPAGDARAKSYSDGFDVVANWGIASAAINGAPETVYQIYQSAANRSSDDSDVAALRGAGENVSGQFIVDAVAKSAFARLKANAAVPLNMIQAPLVSSGTSLREGKAADGSPTFTVFSHSTSRMLQDVMRGPSLFTKEEADMYGSKKRRALCNVNVSSGGFRYAWFLDRAKFEGSDLYKSALEGTDGNLSADSKLLAALANAFSSLRELQSAGSSQALAVREQLCSMFKDHHGNYISGDKYVKNVCFEDLFRLGKDGKRTFDRSAVQMGDDMVFNDATGERHVVLGGTLFGLPRTPSYNGSMWLQTVRAGLPCTEIEKTDENTGTTTYSVGRDAMVSPDPITNKILGCDHDGDKAMLYMYDSFAGDVQTWVPDAVGSEDLDKYRKSLLAKTDYRGNKMVEADPETGGYRFTESARLQASNAMVRSLFDMADGLDVFLPEPGEYRRPFFGLPLSDDAVSNSFTKADPLGTYVDADGKAKSRLSRIIDKYGAPKVIPKGHTLGEVLLSARVSDVSNDASVARGVAVANARTLHYAWLSGAFTDILHNADPMQWERYIYRIDGISNATFDDVKDQKCGRIGWTSGMMKALIVDTLTRNGDKLPTTDDEFEKILTEYSKDISEKGVRYFMKRAADQTDLVMQASLRTLFAGGPGGIVNKASLDNFFGIILTDTGRRMPRINSDRNLTVGQFISACVDEELRSVGREGEVTDVLKVLSSAERELQGALYYFVRQVLPDARKPEDFGVRLSFDPSNAKLRETVARKVIAFSDWKKTYDRLTQAQAFVKAFNYVKADPLSGTESGTFTADDEKFRNVSADVSADVNGVPVRSVVERMHMAQAMMEDIGYGIKTLRAKGVSAASGDAGSTGFLCGPASPGTHVVGGKLACMERICPVDDETGEVRVSEAKSVVLESNVRQVPYVIGVLRSAGKALAVKDSPVSSGTQMYDLLKSIAKNVGEVRRTTSGILNLRKGIEDAFELMYRLVSTSKESESNRVFEYLREATDDGPAQFSPSKYGEAASGLRRIIPLLRGSSTATQDKIRGLVQRVVDGKDFSGTRTHKAGYAKIAKSFALTDETLDAIEKQEGLARSKTGVLVPIAGVAELVKNVRPVLKALSDAGFKKGLTPSVMFGQLLPAYTVLTTQTTGMQTEHSPSLLPLLPKRLYEALSSMQVEQDGSAPAVMKALYAKNWAVSETGSDAKAVSAAEIAAAVELAKDEDGIVGEKELRGSLLGGESVRRSNPEYRNTFDLFAGSDVIRDVVEMFDGLPRARDPFRKTPGDVLGGLASGSASKETSSGNERAEVRRFANAMRALLGTWASVEYSGGSTFKVTGRLKGDAASGGVRVPSGRGERVGARVSILVDVSNDGLVQTERQVRGLASSRAFAASVVSCAELGVTVDEFMELPQETREAFVRRFTVGGASANEVAWSMGADQVMTLTGAIRVDPKQGGTQVYHEYFHTMCSMFRTLDVWDANDVVALQKEFGKAPKGTDALFDEEKAAEAFRKYVEDRADPKAEDVRTVFQKIYDFLKGFWECLRTGFSYGDARTPAADTLFGMMVHGIAERSTSAKGFVSAVNAGKEVDFGHKSDGGVVYGPDGRKLGKVRSENKLNSAYLMRDVVNDEDLNVAHDIVKKLAGDMAASVPSEDGAAPDVGKAMDDAAETQAAPSDIDASDSVTQKQRDEWYAAVNTVEANLLDRTFHIDALRGAVKEAARVRRAMAETAGIDLGPAYVEAPKVSLAVAPLGSDQYRSETVRAAASEIKFAGVEASPFYTVGEAVVESCIRGLKSTGTWSSTLEDALRKYSDGSGDVHEESNRAAVLNGLRMVLQQVNPKYAKSLEDTDIEKSLAFQAALVAYQKLETSFVKPGKDAPEMADFLKSVSEDGSRAERKAEASAYDVSAWCMASHSVEPKEQVEACLGLIAEQRAKAGTGAQAALAHIEGQMRKVLDAVGTPTKAVDFVGRSSSAILNDVIPSLTAGLTKPSFGNRGFLNDYAIAGESDNPYARDNASRYAKCITERTVQTALKSAIQTAFSVAAEVKYLRETGVVPSSYEGLAAAKRMNVAGVPDPVSAGEWLASHGLASSNLLDERGLVDYYDQSFFIGYDPERWLQSLTRKTFGGQSVQEIVMGNEHEFQGFVSQSLNDRNFFARSLGLDVEPGGRLLKLKDFDENFSMEAGVVTYGPKARKNKGFDAYRRDYANGSFDETDCSSVQWFAKSLAVWAKGGKSVITDLGMTFKSTDSSDPADYTMKALEAKVREHKQLSRFEMALWRLGRYQASDAAVVGKEAGQLNYYDRIVDAACDAIRNAHKADDREDTSFADACEAYRNSHGGKQYWQVGNASETILEVEKIAERLREERIPETFNHRVLSALERKGLVTCHVGEDGIAKQAFVSFNVDELRDMFEKSKAYGKLKEAGRDYTVDVGGEQVHCLDRRALAKPLMDTYRRCVAFVKRHPWITEGDAKYLNNFGTMLPHFKGDGYFMYNANRKDRSLAVDEFEKLSRCEARYLAWLKANGGPEGEGTAVLSQMKGDSATPVLEYVADLFGTGGNAADLREAIAAGKYMEGEDAAKKTGLVLPADPSRFELESVIYRKQMENALERSVGKDRRVPASLDAMIKAFEEKRESESNLVSDYTGLTDEQVLRKFGVRPANFDLGHSVKVAIDGITNAVMHRNTLASMLMTPSSDGTPVYYARPSDLRQEHGGLPDKMWETLARWWAEVNRYTYDDTKTGLENATRIYDALQAKGGTIETVDGRKHRYSQLPKKDSDLVSITDWLVQDDEELGGDSSLLNALGGGEAMGYLRQVVGAGRILGFGGAGVRATLHRALSWSKSMSVSFSMFFPLATRFESPIGAVGAMATMAGNLPGGAGFLRSHPETANALMKMFPGSGWITKDFLGFRDVIEMMDTNSPFLAEMVSWAHALGITVSTSEANPMEPTKAIVARDVAKMKQAIRENMGSKAAARFSKVADALLLRPGDKAFTYALNATKLAVVAQLAQKLRFEARKRGKAFDPIRDLRKYSSYLNAEIGGIDNQKYAWAHPMNRGIMNCLMFSWQWTRGAWEAGGGGALEDFLFGGHSYTRQERQYMLGRWARMWGEVMIGVPLLMQMLVKGMAVMLNAMSGAPDDDDDEWWTWKNEDKTRWTAFNLTPLLKAMNRFETVRDLKDSAVLKAVGGIAGGALGGYVGSQFGSARGRIGQIAGGIAGLGLGASMGSEVGSLIPSYTGKDKANATTNNRKYYMHFGKQGWEFFRWFDEPGKQFFSKLSMPMQRILEGFIGRNMSYLDKELPWEDMGALERWINPTWDGATWNIAKAFVPFTVNGISTFGDAGALPIFGPVSMGASRTAINDRLKAAVEKWAANDRGGYRWGIHRKGKKDVVLAPMFQDILRDAKLNGEVDVAARLDNAIGQVMSKYYGQLFAELPDEPGDDYDVRKVEKIARALNRLGATKKTVLQSVKKKLESQHRDWKSVLTDDQRRMYESIVGGSLAKPFNSEPAVKALGYDY